VAREALRLVRDVHAGGAEELRSVALLTVFGAVVALFAGLLALRWLSRWLEAGRWYLFGIYCLLAALAVGLLHHAGY
jgi:undecaprenyl-diphosphatase